MLLPLILLFSLLPLSSFASKIAFSSKVSLDSSVSVSGQMDSDVNWVWIHLEKLGVNGEVQTSQMEENFPRLDQRQVQQKLYLRFGPGQYRVTVRQSKETPQYGSSYYDVSETTIENKDPRDLNFLLPSSEVESDNPEIRVLALQIIQGIDDELAASKAIHDWVATHIAYDVDHYFRNEVKDSTAVETLEKRVAFCNGFAHLNAALHRAVGIPAKNISGQAGTGSGFANHEWNEVFIAGAWIIEDATWDAGGILVGTHDFKYELSSKYFNPSRADFAKDHLLIEVLTGE